MKNHFYNRSVIKFLLFFTLIAATGRSQSNEVVVVDANYSQKQQVLDNLPVGTAVFEIDREENPWQQIREYMEENPSAMAIHLFANTSYNAIQLGSIAYDSAAVDQEFELSMLEGLYQGTHIQLLIYDCNLGSNPKGIALLKKISDRAYFNIAVPTTCSSIFGADLVFDHTTMDQPINNSIFQ